MLPQNPYVLLSYINTKLRDEYSSLYELCEDLNESELEITEKLEAIGYGYDQQGNAFKPY